MAQPSNGVQAFIADCLIQGMENKELIYSFLASLGITHENIYGYLVDGKKSKFIDFSEYIYNVILERIKRNVKMAHGGITAEVSDAYFDQRFGWVIESEIGKAYLGKMALPYNLKIKIGLMSYFSGNSTIIGDHKLEIGSFCSIASDIYIVTADISHPTVYPSTYNFRGNKRLVLENMQLDVSLSPEKEIKYNVKIGNDVWIGRDVTIMNGVKLGDGSVIGTKALVNKDCEPYGIYGGVPAKLIRYRFSQNIISQLLDLKWWEWAYEKIKRNKDFFDLNLSKYQGDISCIVQ